MKLSELCDKYGVSYNKNHADRCRKQLEKYCIFERKGNNYTIIRELTNEEKLLMSDKFTDYMSDILIKHLSNKGRQVTYTYAELFELTGMINHNWREGRSNIYGEIYKKKNETDKFNYALSQEEKKDGISDSLIIEYNLKRFFKTSNRLLKEIVNNSLTSIEKKHLLYWDKTYKLYILPKDKGDYLIERNATEEERSKILDWTKEALDKLGYKTEWIPVEKDRIAFNKFIDDKIKENFGFDTYAKAVRLTLAQDSLKREAYKIDCRRMLNNNVQTKMLESKEMDLIVKALNKQFVSEYIQL